MTITINPQVLRVRDFRTFTSEQVLVLPAEGGTLGLITGINELEPDLGANGTGKSTLWDALSWCLFGKTIRGVRGPSLHPWEREEILPRVQFTFSRNGERMTISRTMKPNTLRLYRGVEDEYGKTDGLDSEVISQDTVQELVGLTYAMFVATVVRGQFADSFLEMSARDKLDFLSEALELGIWEDAAAIAAAERKSISEEVNKLSQHLARGEGACAQAAAAVVNMQKAASDWDANQAPKIAAVELRLSDNQGFLSDVTGDLEKSSVKAEEAKRKTLDLNSRVTKVESEIDELQKAVNVAEAKIDVFGKVADDALAQLASCEEQQDECAHCGSHLDDERRAAMLGRAMSAAKQANETLESEIEHSDRLKKAIEALEERLDLEQGKRSDALGQYTECREQQEADQKMIETFTSRVRSLARELEELNTSNPFDQSVRDAQRDAARLEAKFDKVKGDLETTEKSLKQAEFWAKGFTDVRLWMLRSALDELEALCNSHTLALGLRGWKVLFDVERETKSGTIAKGFTALISSPKTSEPVPFESWSGGELQRLKIAVQAAMIDLIRSRTGGGWRFEVWDEPTQHLSGRGIDDLMTFFRDRAHTQQLEVWVVDHRSLSGGEFGHQLTVTKRPSGSVVRRSAR